MNVPSDEKLSETYGVPVLSWRGEDLPHFKTRWQDRYTPAETVQRAEALFKICRDRALPSFENDEIFASHATSLSAAVFSNMSEMEDQGELVNLRLNFALLHRPSRHIGARQALANAAQMRPDLVVPPWTETEEEHLTTFHEIGHIEQAEYLHLYGNDETVAFENEKGAETFSYLRFLKEGGRPAVIEQKIGERALTGFLSAPPRYFLAPALKAVFLDSSGKQPDFERVASSYNELRARSVDHMTGDNSLRGVMARQKGLANGFETDQATVAKNNAAVSRILDECDDKRPMLSALRNVLRDGGIDGETKMYGQQIIEAANRLVAHFRPVSIAVGAAQQAMTTPFGQKNVKPLMARIGVLGCKTS